MTEKEINNLIHSYDEENNENLGKITKALSEGHFIVSKGELSGAYLTYITYFLSNGETYSIKTPSYNRNIERIDPIE